MRLIKAGTTLDAEGQVDTFGLKRTSSEMIKDSQPIFEMIVEGKSMSSLKREQGESTVHKLIFTLLSTINDYINTVRFLSKNQCIEVAFELMEYNDLKINDYFAFVELFKRGHFGKIYDRVDPLILKEAWEMYLKERGDYLFNQHLDFKARENNEGNSEAYHAMNKLANILVSEEQFLNKTNPDEEK